MLRDLSLAELRHYQPAVEEPADFDEFWASELAAAAAQDAEPVFTNVTTQMQHADVVDVTFPGYAGDPIKGWLLLPHASPPDQAFVVEYIGYGGGRGDPFDWLTWSCAGHPHLIMDTRGQGGGWRSADTPDPSDSGAPSTPGFLTRGIADPRTHYYTRLFIDAAQAVTAARRHPASTGRPLVTTGGSQGGGLAIVAAHLADGVAAALPEVPFLADFRRAVEVTDSRPYLELIEYLSVHRGEVDQVFSTLSYLDVVDHAKRITAPGLFSVGLVDDITPASTVFAAFNHYAGPKQIEVYPFNGLDGGGTQHFLASTASSPPCPGAPSPGGPVTAAQIVLLPGRPCRWPPGSWPAAQRTGGGVPAAVAAKAGSQEQASQACRNADRANPTAVACGSSAARTSSQSSTYSPSGPSQRAAGGDTCSSPKPSGAGCA